MRVTVVDVLSSGGGGRPWHALVATGRHRSPLLHVAMDSPPAVAVGDDMDLHGSVVPSGLRGIPDCFVVAGDSEWASAWELPRWLSAAGRRLGIGRDATPWIPMSRASADPVLAWAMRRFEGVVAMPTILIESRLAPGIGKQGPGGIESLLPALCADSEAATLSKVLDYRFGRGPFCGLLGMGSVRIALIHPYDPARTWMSTAQVVSRMRRTDGFFCRVSVPLEQMRMFSAAHEMAHSIQSACGIAHPVDDETLYAAECFAEAVSIMCTCLEAGHVAHGETMAMLRHVGILRMSSHAVGPACDEAVAVTRAWLDAGRGPEVPMAEIIEAAVGIARRIDAAVDADMARLVAHIEVRAGSREAWLGMPDPARRAVLHAACTECGMWRERGGAGAMLWAGMDALPRVMFGPDDMASPSTRQRIRAAEHEALAELARDLRDGGATAWIPAMLAHEAGECLTSPERMADIASAAPGESAARMDPEPAARSPFVTMAWPVAPSGEPLGMMDMSADELVGALTALLTRARELSPPPDAGVSQTSTGALDVVPPSLRRGIARTAMALLLMHSRSARFRAMGQDERGAIVSLARMRPPDGGGPARPSQG